MKHLILIPIVALGFMSLTATAQDSALVTKTKEVQPQNAIYLEIGGQSLLGATINYERFLSKRPGGFSVRAGIGGALIGIFEGESFAFGALPVGLSYNIPTGSNHRAFFEVGAAYTHLFAGGDGGDFMNGVLGWRYDVNPKGLHIRLNLMPFIYDVQDKALIGTTWFGFSIGKRF